MEFSKTPVLSLQWDSNESDYKRRVIIPRSVKHIRVTPAALAIAITINSFRADGFSIDANDIIKSYYRFIVSNVDIGFHAH